MLLSVIIPCFNEIKTLDKVISRVNRQTKINKQIIVVDDGSSDGSKELIKKIFHDNKISNCIFHKINKGKGACIISGLKKAKGDIILIQYADLEYNPSDYFKLIYPILNNETLVTYGSRVLKKKRYSTNKFTSIYRVFFNHLLTLISNAINQQQLTDAHTCYKVFSAKIFEKITLQENDFSFCPEINTKLSNLKIDIREVPISYNGRSYKDGKKIKFKDGIKALYVLIKYKFFKNL